MSGGTNSNTSQPATIDDEARYEALDLLDKVLRWEHTAVQWREVGHLLDRLLDALEAGDRRAFRRFGQMLEHASPNRVIRVSKRPDPDKMTADNQIRTRVNTLVHRLGDDVPATTGSKDDRSGDASGGGRSG